MDKEIYQKKYLKYKIKYLKLLNPNVQIPRNIFKIYYGGDLLGSIKQQKYDLFNNIVINSFKFKFNEYIEGIIDLIKQLKKIKTTNNDKDKIDEIDSLIKSYENDIFKLDYKKDYEINNFLTYINNKKIYPYFTSIDDFFTFGFQQIIIQIQKLSELNTSKDQWKECTSGCNKKLQQTYHIMCTTNKCTDCKTPDCIKSCKSCEYFKSCKNCYDVLHDLIMLETESTAYMIRAIKHSIITIKDKTTIDIDIDPTITVNLTGKWNNDLVKFLITDMNSTKRLIIGYGPSASGKTYCASTIIKILSNIDGKTIPTSFMSIDGGPCRETSIFYNFIVKCALHLKLDGITNLDKNTIATKLGIGRKSLFPKVKKVIQDFLQNKHISLYIPTTSSINKKNLNKYISITNDNNWIALLIWQHKTDSSCIYNKDPFLKCKGCYNSGIDREKDEGKIYDRTQKQWGKSMDIGTLQIKIAPGGGYSIHNSGRRGGDLMIIDWTSLPPISTPPISTPTISTLPISAPTISAPTISTPLITESTFPTVIGKMGLVNKFINNLKQRTITSNDLLSNVMFIEKYKITFDKNKLWYEDQSIIKTEIGIDERRCKINPYYNGKYVYGCKPTLSQFNEFKILKARPTIFNVIPKYLLLEKYVIDYNESVISSNSEA